jgi:uncharacterized protein
VGAHRTFRVPPVETHLIESRSVGQTYQIQVMQPLIETGSDERFPVLYLTDGNLSFDFAKGIAHCLQSSGEVRRFILVAIGYPGDNPFAGDVLRCRDLTPSRRREIPGLPRTSPIHGVQGIAAGERLWGGAAGFLDFIRNELIPFIDVRYPTVAAERAYFGHSLGGAFGLHALFAHPGTFSHYAISSPGVSYDGDDDGIQEAQEFVGSGKPLPAGVFMTVGEREEFEPDYQRSQMVSSFYRLAALLRRARPAGLNFDCEMIPGETHLSVWPTAFSHAIRVLFGPADRAPTT